MQHIFHKISYYNIKYFKNTKHKVCKENTKILDYKVQIINSNSLNLKLLHSKILLAKFDYSIQKLTQDLQKRNIEFGYYIEGIKSEVKIKERLSQLLLAKSMEDFSFDKILHKENGKPFLSNSNLNISISNSNPFIALQIGNSKYCGIDIQTFSDKIGKIAPKFTTEEEVGLITKEGFDELHSQHIIWSGKESVYKAMEIGGLAFRNEIKLIELKGDSLLFGIRKNDLNFWVNVFFQITRHYCLAVVNSVENI